jgi:2-phosphoglycerate kinase
MDSPYIILISGGTGIGTSTIAGKLSDLYPVRGYMRTDAIRQVIRTVAAPLTNPEVFQSTYRAYENLDSAYSDPIIMAGNLVLFGHVRQSETVLLGVDGSIARDIEEKINSIYEGVHILPGKLKEKERYDKCLRKKFAESLNDFGMKLVTYDKYIDHIIEIFIDIEDPNLHRRRLEQREEFAPDRSSEKYMKNFENIRTIQGYMKSLAIKNSIPIVQNTNLEEAVNECVRHISLQTQNKFLPKSD